MGNRSTGRSIPGVPRTLVRMPGYLVRGTICIPRCHAHALWLLPWVERLIEGASLAELLANPPWPSPPESLVQAQLARELVDLGWAIPAWGRGGLVVRSELIEDYRREGRQGLARRMYGATEIPGAWWMDGLGGALLAQTTAQQFDWDLQRKEDLLLKAEEDAQALLDSIEPDLGDLVLKLGGVEIVWSARNQAFMAGPLELGERKDLLFPLFGRHERLLPDELSELEPTLVRCAPHIFGERQRSRSRIVRLPASPVEALARDLQSLRADPVTLGPIGPVRVTVERMQRAIVEQASSLTAWLDEGQRVVPVAGETQRHFDALAELCEALPSDEDSLLLFTSAFLNERNLTEPDGLVEALRAAPDRTRFLLAYGHASDDLPEQLATQTERWMRSLRQADPDIAARFQLRITKRRSHEKAVVTSTGGWMVGSWNPASSRPHATVFEASLRGQDPSFAKRILDRLGENLEGEEALGFIGRLGGHLTRAKHSAHGKEHVEELECALALLAEAIPTADGGRAEAWRFCLQATRRALLPFLCTARVELVDEQQTRDAFLQLARSTRRHVLLASDRLADSALDGATLRDLQGDGRARPTVRVVWGREWAGGSRHGKHVSKQLARARRTVREARATLGRKLRTSDQPMENHAKALLVDGRRGLVTSENLLSYGGEKGRYESRELGVLFWSPSVTRHLLGRFLLQWPGALDADELGPDLTPHPWLVAVYEAWHGLAGIQDELDFDWRAPSFLLAAVRDEAERAEDDQADARRRSLHKLETHVGDGLAGWLLDEAQRLGLTAPMMNGAWRPYDVSPENADEELMEAAAEAVAALPPRPSRVATAGPSAVPGDGPSGSHPLVARVMEGIVRVPAGSFTMGDRRCREESPEHRVTITHPFLLGRTPVTQGLWEAVMGRLPSLRDVENHPEHPIIKVDLREVRAFIAKLNELPGGGGFVLPTEAQWEYACRAGADTVYHFGNDPGPGKRPGLLERYAWTKRSRSLQLQKVALLEPNAFGLYDMHGLVYEATRDGPRKFTRKNARDPVGPTDTHRVVARGGFWGRFPVDARRPWNEHFRCASRQKWENSYRCSFRIARIIDEETS